MAGFNLADMFEMVADTVPERCAIVDDKKRLNYADLDDRANRLANHLQAQGIGEGDHIGLQLRNGSEYMEGMLAAYKIRAVPININFNYVEKELLYLFDNADLKALVAHQQYLPRVANIQAELPKLQTVLYVTDNSGADTGSYAEYESVLQSSAASRDFPERSGEDLYIIYTGGTTGMPKGVMWRQEDIFFAACGGGDPDRSKGPITAPEQIRERVAEFEMGALPAPPLMHAAAQWTALNTLLGGAKLVLIQHYKPEQVLQLAVDENIVAISLVGDAMAVPMIEVMDENPGRYQPAMLMAIASGGALFSPSTKERLLKHLPNTLIMDGLGSSETGLMGNKMSTGAEAADREPRFEVNDSMIVIDEQQRPIPPGSDKVGMLAKKGHVPLGYYKAPEKSAETFVTIDGQRWAIPGDMATVNADGTILLHGRGSTSINTGGEKVFPEEVESALKAHPDILDAVVVGVADERWGQKITALLRKKAGSDLESETLQSFCRDYIAGYKVPKVCLFLDEIKRSPAGKADYPWAKKTAEEILAQH